MSKRFFINGFATIWLLCQHTSLAEEEIHREWRNATATASFFGEFVSLDGDVVVIRKDDEKEFKLPLSRLHKKDVVWIREYLEEQKSSTAIEEMGVFGSLKFGDSRREVLEKLQKSPLVTSNDGGLFGAGKTGLDGKFRTKKTVGDANCYLYFDFKGDKLCEVSLMTEDRSTDQYSTSIKKSWREMVDLFGILYGEPTHDSKFPFVDEVLSHGQIAVTHKWEAEEKGYVAILGPAVNADRKLYVYVRISSSNS